MRTFVATTAAVWFLVACNSGQKACEGYVDAYNACIEANGSGYTIDADIIGCDLVDNDNADFYSCLDDAYTNGDCTTNDGWSDTLGEAATCSYPTDTE